METYSNYLRNVFCSTVAKKGLNFFVFFLNASSVIGDNKDVVATGAVGNARFVNLT